MYSIGIDLGGTNIAVGLINKDGGIVHKDSVPTLRERPYEAILKDMGMLVLEVVKDAGVKIEQISGIGRKPRYSKL